MYKAKTSFKMIKNNLFAFRYICSCAPRRAVLDLIRLIYLPFYYFLEHTYVYKFVLDSIQYKRPFIYVVYYMAGLFVGQIILYQVWESYDIYFREKDEMKIIKKLQFDVYERAVKIDLINYDNKEFYDDYVWNINDAKTRFLETYGNVISFMNSVLNLIIYGTFIILSDSFGLILIAALFIAHYFLDKKANKIIYKNDMELRSPRRLRDYVKRVFYIQDYANELRMNHINDKFHEKNKEAKDASIKIIKKYMKPFAIIRFIGDYILNNLVLQTGYLLYLAYKALVLKLMSYGTIISIINALQNFEWNMYDFTDSVAQLNRHSLYIEKYKDFLNFKSNIKSGEYKLNSEKIEKIELRNISFGYEENKPVLKNINMTINKGEKIAIVGYNGAGKTTLSNIILRLYEQNAGEILINNRPAEEINLESYKNKFSAVFQDFYLYAASVRENITLDVQSEEKRIRQAAHLSGFEGKLNSLEKGLDTNLTKEFEDSGVNLSGGETQKLAIARAIYRNSEVIIMDEPSSALDPIAEFNFNQTITQIAHDRIVFFISHRLSTTKIADKIFYIENGEITESGSHDELMQINGKYAEMFNVQAEKYGNKK